VCGIWGHTKVFCAKITPIVKPTPTLNIADPVKVMQGPYSSLRGTIIARTKARYSVEVRISPWTTHLVHLPLDGVRFCDDPEPKADWTLLAQTLGIIPPPIKLEVFIPEKLVRAFTEKCIETDQLPITVLVRLMREWLKT